MYEKLMRLSGVPVEQLAVFCNDFGNQLCAESMYPEAQLYFVKALEICNTSVSVNFLLLTMTHDHMATALEGLEQIDEAIYCATQATETASSALGPDHPDTKAYRNHLDQLMRKLQFV